MLRIIALITLESDFEKMHVNDTINNQENIEQLRQDNKHDMIKCQSRERKIISFSLYFPFRYNFKQTPFKYNAKQTETWRQIFKITSQCKLIN